MDAINLASCLDTFDEAWTPRVIAELNGQQVRVAKCRGEYVWHHHDEEDEMFLVLEGRLEIHFRDRVVSLGPGECCVVPRGVEHRPVAETLTSILLFEPASTRSTGNVTNHALTIEPEDLERL